MQAVRHLLAQRHLAVLICAAALMMKLLIPAGYMIGSDGGRLSIILCSGIAAPAGTPVAGMPMAGPMPEMHGDMADHGQPQDHGRAEMPCAFSGLSAASLGAVDAVQLAALIAFVMAIGLTGMLLPLPSAPAHLRPPLRGPPLHL
ncbi:hypothetical protein [Sphingomonas sp.]|uniref:hypothetical protein n=1 Tax=Sphingomonas sp. TaxID=28214 RepID=UPI0035B4083A